MKHHYYFCKKFGFTLAETLITLGIIGIVAILTIPNLIQNYKKHHVEVGLKEAYSLLSNALEMAKLEHSNDLGYIIETSTTNGSNSSTKAAFFTNNYLIPYLRIQRKCTATDTNASTCRFIKYPNDRRILLNGTTENTKLGNSANSNQIQLANGMYVSIFAAYGHYSFIVDLNAAKGPNRIGYDIFVFSLYPANWWTDYRPTFTANGEMGYGGNCSTNGASCAYYIMKNSWHIPSDYPVQKW